MQKVKLTQAARKRRIGKARIIAAMNRAEEPQRFPAEGDLDERLLWIGEDDRGIVLEIIGIELPDYLLIIHVMPVRLQEKMMAAKKTKRSKYKLGSGGDIDLKRDDILDRRGRRITDDYVRRAVDDVHEKMGRGRPSLSGRAKPSPQVTFRLPPALRAKAEARAKREGKRVSEVAREALERYLVS